MYYNLVSSRPVAIDMQGQILMHDGKKEEDKLAVNLNWSLSSCLVKLVVWRSNVYSVQRKIEYNGQKNRTTLTIFQSNNPNCLIKWADLYFKWLRFKYLFTRLNHVILMENWKRSIARLMLDPYLLLVCNSQGWNFCIECTTNHKESVPHLTDTMVKWKYLLYPLSKL